MVPYVLACGNCVYDAMCQSFPPTATWCVIWPVWLVVLSVLKSCGWVRLAMVPSVFITIPLVLLVSLCSPAVLGPLLGVWIPLVIVLAVLSSWNQQPSLWAHSLLVRATGLALCCLIVGAIWDYSFAATDTSLEARPPVSRHGLSEPK